MGPSGNSNGDSPATPISELRPWRSHLILLGTPRELNIPYFAIGDPQSRENAITPLGIDGKLSKLSGRRFTAWINGRKNQDKIGLIETRNYIPPKTAFYAEWLLLESEAAFEEFLEAFPHYCLDTRIAKINEEREALAADLKRRTERRDFDLSHVGDEKQRENLARRYVETREKLWALQEHSRLLDMADRVRQEWEAKLSR